ncbi:hypothetical protein Tco_0796298 [Tanacetum coccineum]
MKKKGLRASGSLSMNDEALARLMVSEMATQNKRAIKMRKEERKAFMEIKGGRCTELYGSTHGGDQGELSFEYEHVAMDSDSSLAMNCYRWDSPAGLGRIHENLLDKVSQLH